jgi:hypothetical protein
MPVYTPFAPDSSYTVRYLRLVFSNSVLTRQFKITGLHYLFNFGKVEDGGDVFQDVPGPVGVGDGGTGGGALLLLHPGVPNPFQGSTLIRYESEDASEATLTIFDAAGREVRAWNGLRGGGGLGDGPGGRTLHWDGRDASGRAVPAGVYVCELRSGAHTARQKLMRLR